MSRYISIYIYRERKIELPSFMREKVKKKKKSRGHTDLNHGPIGLQPIALPLSYIPTARVESKAGS